MRPAGAILLGVLMVTTPVASALPTPGFFGEEAREATGRLFPEAMETNDFVGIDEALENLRLLEEENPDLVTFHEIGESYGWDNAAGGHDRQPVFAVTLTNEESSLADDEKLNLLFMLSIHGNEKGAREGGLRIIEDFTKAANGDTDRGIASEQRLSMLDYTRLIFIFPNPDGWAHEEAEYRHDAGGDQAVTPLNFVRGNGNGTDLNRQAPTKGWSPGEGGEASHSALREPEPRAYIPWLKNEFEDIDLATDIHGMLHPADSGVLFDSTSPEIACVPAGTNGLPGGNAEICLREGHFVLPMVPAAQMDPAEVEVTTALAEEITKRLNANPEFSEWHAAPETGVWGGEFAEWGTVWDTIGYTDAGFSGDFFAQEHGLDAPGIGFELAYNHITWDNYYPGLAQRMNAYHVEATRTIVASYMDLADQTFDVDIETNGQATGYVPTEYVATSDQVNLTGWAATNDADDVYDWQNGPAYEATPNAWFEERNAFLVDDGSPTQFEALDPGSFDQLDQLDNLVVPGSAAERILEDEQAIDALRAFVEEGGNILLTDEALRLLAPLDVVGEDAIDVKDVYAGHTNFEDRGHELAAGVRGLARQTFEPVPLGYEAGVDSPAWFVQRDAVEDADAEVVGVLDEDEANLGQISLGEGEITFLGALLPDPSQEHYHPYGLTDHATTYTGNQIVRNALGWELTVDKTPREGVNDTSPVTGETEASDDELGSASTDDGANGVPFGGPAAVLTALAAALVALRGRRGN